MKNGIVAAEKSRILRESGGRGDDLDALAAKADVSYMLALDADRLLAPFRREAKLPEKAKNYGNWESCGLDGHTLGHYLSALADLIASGNDANGELRRRLDYIVDELAARKAAREAAAAAERRREEATLDRVRPGEQQPETEHDLAMAKNGEKGYHSGRHWRHGSWFAYTLDPKGAKNLAIEATYWGDDHDRTFDVLVNGVVVKTVKLDGSHRGEFFSETYPIPAEALAVRRDGKVRVTFAATNGGLAGGLFDLRLMKAE